VITVIGVLVLAGGIYFAYDTMGLLSRSLSSTATVIDLQYNSDGQATPVLQFTDKIGATITTRLNEARKPPAYAVGDKVSIIYDVKSPNNIRVDSFLGIWLVPIVMTLLGAVFSFVGFTNYWNSRQWA
jgi:hypothetical protein